MHLQRHEFRQVAPATPDAPPGSTTQRFAMIPATTAELVKQTQQLRYRVYCVENSFENPSRFPDGLEHDEFDPRAIHGLLVDRTCGIAAGTVRLILPSAVNPSSSLPIQRLCPHPLTRDRRLLGKGAAEISRFAVSKEYRRLFRESLRGEERCSPPPRIEEELLSSTTLALIRGVVQLSTDHGITELFAVMEPALLRLLGRFAIHFSPLGPLVAYHGRRQPCHVNLPAMIRRASLERPDIWSDLTGSCRRYGAA